MFNQHNSSNSNFPAPKGIRKSALALALAAMILPACTVNEPEATAPEVQPNVEAEDVAEDTENLIGQMVTVRNKVGKKIDAISFTIVDNQFFGGNEILVINTSGSPFVLPTDDTEVQVTGEVRQFKVVEFERDFGLDLEPKAEYENKPVIAASSIALAPDPGEITQNPDRFYNQRLAVEGEVEEILGPNAFTLDEDELVGGGDLLVLTVAAPAQVLGDEDEGVVTGEVRPFVLAEVERDYDLTWDLDIKQKLEAEYSEKPVLISAGIYPKKQ